MSALATAWAILLMSERLISIAPGGCLLSRAWMLTRDLKCTRAPQMQPRQDLSIGGAAGGDVMSQTKFSNFEFLIPASSPRDLCVLGRLTAEHSVSTLRGNMLFLWHRGSASQESRAWYPADVGLAQIPLSFSPPIHGGTLSMQGARWCK